MNLESENHRQRAATAHSVAIDWKLIDNGTTECEIRHFYLRTRNPKCHIGQDVPPRIDEASGIASKRPQLAAFV
jgi:hypothetical protein